MYQGMATAVVVCRMSGFAFRYALINSLLLFHRLYIAWNKRTKPNKKSNDDDDDDDEDDFIDCHTYRIYHYLFHFVYFRTTKTTKTQWKRIACGKI